jgi:DNA-binding SARP family transcriptional activator
MNPILSRIAAGAYAEGLSTFEALRVSTSEDERLAAICLFNLQAPQRARDLLLSARAGGCEAAGIELASAYRQLGLMDLARDALTAVDTSRLSPFDRALALREWGAQRYAAGDVTGAIEVLERAWALAHQTSLRWMVLPAIGHALGAAYADRGFAQQAVEYLAEALTMANPARRVQLLATRSLCRTYLGALDEADRDLDEAGAHQDLVPLVGPYLEYVAGVLQLMRGRLAAAEMRFGEAAAAARAAQEPETEAYAELGRCAIATVHRRLDEARAFLARAKHLASNEKLQSLTRLRECAILTRQRRGGAVEAGEAAAQSFGQLGLLREQGWCQLHVAAAHLGAGRHSEALRSLSEAARLRHALGGGAWMVPELRLVPPVTSLLARLGEEAYPRVLYRDLRRVSDAEPVPLELSTLGSARLRLDGRRVRLDLRRSLEVLAYLLANPETTIDQVLLDLFPDSDAARARSYFHQVRYELARAVPGLTVPYRQRDRTYRVRSEGLELISDVARLRRALSAGGEAGLVESLRLYRGPFLPDADSEWSRVQREDLAWSIRRLGVEVMQELRARRDHRRRLELADRLVEIDPFDETLNEQLVGAARAVGGGTAARSVAERLTRRFEQELGVVPPRLERLLHGR